ncbi:hypothetical protein IP88_01625 [alpha proteobacterium AAP81b]|nr:hypothetical protein IP88_01625 [alpha proteobacterium AAP81b]
MTFFLDTNILIYAIDDGDKRQVASSLVREGTRIAVQSLNEFVLVARRKLRWSWHEIHDALDELAASFGEPVPLTYDVHRVGIDLAERYQFRIYDALIVAAAIVAGADTLYSEDMHDGLVVSGRLTIRNPFRA